MAERLRALAALPEASLPPDHYGVGGAIEALETEVAARLGKPAARFVPSGVAAQGAALRRWAEASGSSRIALHPRSHMAVDEEGALELLYGLVPVRIGDPEAPFSAAELRAAPVAPAAAVVELPLRRAAFRLPPYVELGALAAAADDGGFPLHLDGARLFEAAAGYGLHAAEVAGGFASVYVSLYKRLGGFGGALLLGEADWLEQVDPWLVRSGARLFDASPLALAALDGLRTRLPRLARDVARARRLATALVAAGLEAAPDPPHVNAFQLRLPASAAAVMAAAEAYARDRGDWLCDGVFALDGRGVTELQLADAADDFDDAEVVSGVLEILDRARRGAV